MNCYVDPVGEMAFIWVPHGVTEAQIKAACRETVSRGLQLVIFRSGTANLADVTARLLSVNV